MSAYSMRIQVAGLIVWLAVSFFASAFGAVATMQAGEFYTQLIRPEWAPPPSIFGPVWSVLYALMGVAAWLIWRVDGFRSAWIALSLYLIQLVPNALWSWFFFAWRQGGMAFWDIIILWLGIVATLVTFYRIKPLAGALLAPYLAWVTFAVFLNFSLWKLNPHILG
jgi:translocator protein